MRLAPKLTNNKLFVNLLLLLFIIKKILN